MPIPRIAKVLTGVLSAIFFLIIYFVVLVIEDGYVEKDKESTWVYPSVVIGSYQPPK